MLPVAAGIATGAFGTHALKSIPGYPPDRVDVFMTATHYAIFNGLGLCIVSLHPRFSVHRFAGPAIAVGGFLFSATMMAVVLARGRLRGLAPVIPLGGMITLAGYADRIYRGKRDPADHCYGLDISPLRSSIELFCV
ncbi:hypothetical protein BC826DRAFT_902589 [Russula brevipes]|nr:hypothetical protein BC826DRAFT_902589 [Russula brevipes]